MRSRVARCERVSIELTESCRPFLDDTDTVSSATFASDHPITRNFGTRSIKPHHPWTDFLCKVSRRPMVRLNTGRAGVESLSRTK